MDKTSVNKTLVNKIFQFDDNSSITFLFEDTLEVILQGKTDSGFTSANVKLTKEETIQFVEWITSQNH